METQFTDAEPMDLNASPFKDETTNKNIQPKPEDTDQRRYFKQSDSSVTTSNDYPQEKVQKYKQPRQQANPQKHTVKKSKDKVDKDYDQSFGTVKPHNSNHYSNHMELSFRQNHPPSTTLTYEVTTTPIKMKFQILNPDCIQWRPTDRHFVLKLPHHVHIQNASQPQQHQTPIPPHVPAGDHDTYVIIPGLRIIEISNTHLYFRPAQNCQKIFKEERMHCHNVIKLRLTYVASRMPLLIPKGTYLGRLYITLPMSVQIF